MTSKRLTVHLCIAFLALAPWVLAQDGAAPKRDGETANPPAGEAAGDEAAGNDADDAAAATAAAEQRARNRARQQFARYLKKLDADGDGKISREEVGPRRNIMRNDTNGDGVIDEAEFIEVRLERDRRARRAELDARRVSDPHERDLVADAREQLAHLDKNGDGKLQPEEGRAMFHGRESADIDGDGAVVLDELVIYHRNKSDRYTRDFSRIDTNRNNLLSPKEAPEVFASYPDADADGDGSISRRELAEAQRLRRQQRRDRFRMPAKDQLAALDSDGDGRLSPQEAAELLELRPGLDADGDGGITAEELEKGLAAPPPATAPVGDSNLRHFLERADKNGDGVLRGKEAVDIQKRFPGIDADEDGVVTMQEISAVLARVPARLDPYSFASHDRNKDGKITKDESPALFKKGNIDADGDGVITPEEFTRLPGAGK